MAAHKYIDRICLAAALLSLLLTACFVSGSALGIQPASRSMGYEERLFDTGRVHTVDILMDGWESFLETCENEEYTACAVVIDGEAYQNVGFRAKGNTSLSNVSAMGSSRYSFKIEFDHYDSGKTCHGLDKLCLNNLIQDNTYLKDYLTYRLMGEFGAAAPLCSFVRVTVNGEDWGLYLAVEGLEDSFLQRNYGTNHGDLYKPDSMNFGGGRGNGRDFRMEDMDFGEGRPQRGERPQMPENLPENGEWPGMPGNPSENGEQFQMPGGPSENGEQPQMPEDLPENGERPQMPGGFPGNGGMGSEAVKLKYTDDDPESYAEIFDSAKTEVTPADEARLIRALKQLGEGDSSALDVDALLRYFVVHNYVVNGDSYTGGMVHNYYLYEEDGRLAMLPWDYNLAFGTFQGGSAEEAVNDPIDTPMSCSGDGDRPMMDWILGSETYRALYHQYFREFLETVDVQAIIEEAYGLIRESVAWDPAKFCTEEEFEAGVQALRTFCTLRSESVLGQLNGTVPSTEEGQSGDGGGLIDCGTLDLSDMGTMGQGGGFRGGGGRDAGSSDGNGRAVPNAMAFPAPERPAGETSGEQGTALLLCLVSALTLLAGLAAAFRWRRRMF